MKSKRAQVESFWTRRSGWLCLAVVVLVSVIGYWLDRFLVYGGLPRTFMLVVSNTLTGIVTGGLFLYVVRNERAHRDQLHERMQTVAELNHHIRNALQVIKLCGIQPEASLDGRQLQLIKESADRIEWALREVLPKYPAEAPAVMRQPPVGYAAASAPVRAIGPPFDERRHATRLH
jgi:hypothetical protein